MKFQNRKTNRPPSISAVASEAAESEKSSTRQVWRPPGALSCWVVQADSLHDIGLAARMQTGTAKPCPLHGSPETRGCIPGDSVIPSTQSCSVGSHLI